MKMNALLTKILKGIKNPITGFNFLFSLINNKFRITEGAKVLGGGERLVIRNWQSAKDATDFTLSHIKRYEWVSPKVKGLHCLDLACGCGYGTHYLAKNGADRITGTDISLDAVRFARKYYKSENLEFFPMDALDLKFENDSFDAVTCFEILEHVDEEGQNKLLAESARVLKNDGALYISSPNASVYQFLRKFHLKELTMAEFESLLRKFYRNVEIFGQDLIVGGIRQKKSMAEHNSKLSCDNFIIVKDDIESCYGLLAICKNKIK